MPAPKICDTRDQLYLQSVARVNFEWQIVWLNPLETNVLVRSWTQNWGQF